MYTVILAGGFGTRLKSVAGELPKPMVPVSDKPFLHYMIDNLKKNELYDYIFCLHYLPEKIIGYFGDGKDFGIKIYHNIEERPMGTGGALGLIRSMLTDTFCVINADTYFEMDMQKCLKLHKESGAIATMALTRVKNASRYGTVERNTENNIIAFSEKVTNMDSEDYINAGVYFFEPEVLDYIPKGSVISLEKDVFPKLIQEKKRIFGYDKVTNFFDIGVPNDYYKFLNWMKLNQGRL